MKLQNFMHDLIDNYSLPENLIEEINEMPFQSNSGLRANMVHTPHEQACNAQFTGREKMIELTGQTEESYDEYMPVQNELQMSHFKHKRRIPKLNFSSVNGTKEEEDEELEEEEEEEEAPVLLAEHFGGAAVDLPSDKKKTPRKKTPHQSEKAQQQLIQ